MGERQFVITRRWRRPRWLCRYQRRRTRRCWCKGFYLVNETADSFEVRELGGGKANVAFDYRIIARRKGYETIRLADKTKQFEQAANEPRPASGKVAVPKATVPKIPQIALRGAQ